MSSLSPTAPEFSNRLSTSQQFGLEPLSPLCKKECPLPCQDPCKDPCQDPCKDPCKDPCRKYDMGYGWGWLGALILWFVVFTVLFWLIYYSLKPSFVLQTDSNQVDTAKVLLAAVISSLALVILIWLIKAAVSRRC